jgi:hypothetical protein
MRRECSFSIPCILTAFSKRIGKGQRRLGLPHPIRLRRRGDPIQGIESYSMGKYRFSSASLAHGVVVMEWRG